MGVYWDEQSDTFKFKAVQAGKPSTKRGVLSVVSSLFDPLGFLHLCSPPRFCCKNSGEINSLGIKRFRNPTSRSGSAGWKSYHMSSL